MTEVWNNSVLVQFPRTVVFNDHFTAGYSFQDIDLSAVVGSRRAVVILKCAKDAQVGNHILFNRRNGDVGSENGNSNVYSLASPGSYQGHMVADTDDNGVIEVSSDENTHVWTITVEAFIYA